MDIEVSPDGTVTYSVWWKNGSMLVNRQYLSPDHPESLYQQFLKNGLVPEHYGLRSFNDIEAEEFKDWNRDRLINEILELRRTVLRFERAGF
jgi:hypothetical protein